MNSDEQDDNGMHHRPWGRRGLRHLEHVRRVQFGQRGFLRPEMLELLEKQPMNGVDIMNELQRKSHGWYRPSPGSIYPLLDQLEREGLVVKNEDGKFELTSAYGEQLGVGENAASALYAMESNASFLEDLQRTDAAGLSKYRDRIEKLKGRLEALGGEPRSGSGTQ